MNSNVTDKAFGVVNGSVLILLSFLCVYPFYYTLVASFSDPNQLMMQNKLLFFPLGFTTKGYSLVFQHPNLLNAYKNTILYVVSTTVLTMFTSSIAAYVLSRRGLKYTKYLMAIMVFTMFFNGGLIPNYLLINNLGMLDSPLALIIPGCISAWNIIILRTSFMAIPDSLEESAKIDGARDMRILFEIILPLSKATLAVIALNVAVAVWNSWFSAMIYIRSPEHYPLALILRQILILNATNTTTKEISQLQQDSYKRLVQYAVIIVATVPILSLYPFLQKYFVKGVMIGSIKQ